MRNILFSNIFFYIFTKNVIVSFSGQSSEDYFFEGSSEGSSDLRDFSLDYQGQDRHLAISVTEILSAKFSWFTCWNHWTLSAICASSISSLSANFLGCDGFLPLLYTLVLCIITMLVLASSWVRDDWQLIFVCVSTPT